ncbi:uncharacterized protein Z518_03224 [Rhinocladiella mackenziei CBS 650.93]|uniref:Rhinocladiella mackenziei CBS 650.93 unplaced genomic scaffold supercont1.2, whole genome shotgun sequence n=1 Tax=Rhinocladiella mackenziei CBS 650.93 TaxID=1442369 RepID=A0A0D2HDH7_9EURO|nr:uncharacterized protein Z518_03224 [Rhinocladiella mackenziei CBS 650.93]KIX08568.1 hypothetical protein Z518_03224 [Rhinocladiella mackenziei CBS 650.93]
MTEKQARRPPVAPKPSFIQQDAASPKTSPVPSPALRGATTAFGPGPAKLSNDGASHNPSAGALLAATAAASKIQQNQRQQQAQPARQNAPSPLEPPSTPRGRALTTENLPVAVSNHSSISPSKPGFQPHLPRSTSAVAAVAASARTSPARRPEIKRDQTGSYLKKPELSHEVRQRGMSTSSNSETVQSRQKSPDALAGAIASMTTAPVQAPAQNTSVDRQKTDLGPIPRLTLQSPHRSSASSPPPSGTAAAVTATKNAASVEARKRTPSTSGEGALNDISRDIGLSAQPIASSWPRIRFTPPQTDSESDSVRTTSETPRKPLPAPIPLRPSVAAIIAQEQANKTNSNSPILDARTKMTASSLADAMVASSLASQHTGSRVAPPSKKVPPAIPRRRSKSVRVVSGGRHHSHFPSPKTDSVSHPPKLTPLPVRPMRRTLRNQSPERDDVADEQTKRGRRHWRRHPNMHHEGDRKRWRDKVTERERKRYEGVWAANKGVLVDHDLDNPDLEPAKDGTLPSDLVVNVVVRDIWERSRLPKDVLEEVWDLVSQPGAKTLNREEFVVGLWLIDQRLKGRKLPIKVSPSVWQSVRHTQGVKIPSKPLQK